MTILFEPRVASMFSSSIDLVFTNWENEENPPARTRDTLPFSFDSFLQKLHLDVSITCGSALRFGLTNHNMVTWLKKPVKDVTVFQNSAQHFFSSESLSTPIN